MAKKVLTEKEQKKLNKKLYLALFKKESVDIICSWLEQGADVNAEFDDCVLPLNKVANRYHEDMAVPKLLLKKGAKINQIENFSGSTALHQAVIHSNMNMINLLLTNGADPNIKGSHKESMIDSIFRTIEWKKPTIELDILKILVEFGLKVNNLYFEYSELIYHKSPLEYSCITHILKSAIILGKLFEENSIENMNEDLKSHLQKELKFPIDLVNNQTKIIEFSQQSYKKSFKSQLAIELKSAIVKGAKYTNNLLRIVDNNIQKAKSLSNIDFEEIYQKSMSNLHELCRHGDYSILSLEATANIQILKLLASGEFTKKQVEQILTVESFTKLEAFEISAAGQTNMEGVD